MLTKMKEVMSSREFQTGAGQVAIAVVSIVVSTTVSKLIATGLNNGLKAMMDKIHGAIEEVKPAVEA